METCGDLHFGGTQRLACRAISARVVVLVGHHIAQTLQLRFVVDLFGPFYGAIAVPLSRVVLLSSSSLWTSVRRRRATVATPGEWQCGVRRLAVANGPNIFQMLLVVQFVANKSDGRSLCIYFFQTSKAAESIRDANADDHARDEPGIRE